MKAQNTSDKPLRLVGGEVAPGDIGEFTEKEFKFLTGIGRANESGGPTDDDTGSKKKETSEPKAPPQKKTAAKKPAPKAPDFR